MRGSMISMTALNKKLTIIRIVKLTLYAKQNCNV